MYFDYPDVTDETELDAVEALLGDAQRRLRAVLAQNDPNEFDGVRYANPYDCSTVRARALEQCEREIKRHTATITRVMADEAGETMGYCRCCGALTDSETDIEMCADCQAEEFPADAGGFDQDAAQKYAA